MRANSAIKIILLFAVFSLMIPGYTIPSAEAAKPTTCTGDITEGTFKNIVVPSGESCFLFGDVVVNGDVKVKESASLTVCGSEIKGNVQANGGAEDVLVVSVFFRLGDGLFRCGEPEVGGNVQVKGATGNVNIGTADIGGNVQIEKHSGVNCISAFRNTIGGNLKFHNNAGTGCINIGANTVAGNFQLTHNNIIDEFLVEGGTVGGNFICLGNLPNNPPTIGGLIVVGEIVGDCTIL